MPAARFCSECGEQLEVKRAHLPLRAFCRNCSPAFKTGRLMLLVAFAASMAMGFAVGRCTSSRAPFYLMGMPVESSITSQAPDAAVPNLSTEAEAPGPSVTRGMIEGICGAPTKSGKPCQRKVKGGGYCWQHRDKFPDRKSAEASEPVGSAKSRSRQPR